MVTEDGFEARVAAAQRLMRLEAVVTGVIADRLAAAVTGYRRPARPADPVPGPQRGGSTTAVMFAGGRRYVRAAGGGVTVQEGGRARPSGDLEDELLLLERQGYRRAGARAAVRSVYARRPLLALGAARRAQRELVADAAAVDFMVRTGEVLVRTG